ARTLVAGLVRRYAGEKPDLTDGLRLNREEAWALVRPSGTEPLVRITVEARRERDATELLEELQRAIETALPSGFSDVPGP
ncbi:MAG: hypothetical protein LUQ60_02300, partial [Methanomicrobiales archaeon]|nr:hypothetical protein [Methanomicrobiales archaeon]